MTSVGVMASAVSLGSCTAMLNESFTTLANWTATGVTTLAAGRTGNAIQYGNAGDARYDFGANETAVITLGFAYKGTAITAQRSIFYLYSDSGSLQHNRLLWDNTGGIGQLKFTRGASTTIASSANGALPSAGVWYYIEVQAKLHDTTGFVIVRVNGTNVINATGLDTRNGGTKSVYDTLFLSQGGNSGTTLVDDLYITAGPDCTFQGDHTIP